MQKKILLYLRKSQIQEQPFPPPGKPSGIDFR